MKQTIINLLKYPRILLKETLAIEPCPHTYLYNKHDLGCLECSCRTECEWLYKNDTADELNKKSEEQLVHELQFTMTSIQAYIAQWEHNSSHCQCEACVWLKTAQDVYDKNKHETNKSALYENKLNYDTDSDFTYHNLNTS